MIGIKPTMYVITGPTASGKSALAVDLARRLGTEIISADSRQIYQGIPIVTAMPTPEERAAVKHHLIDMLPLDAYYSASQFEEDALRIAEDVMNRTGSVVVCGGSMMYVDALCHGIDELPTVPDSIRKGLMEEHAEKGDAWLLDQLQNLDPEYYGKVDKKNIKRVFHAVEIIRAAGKTYTELRTGERRSRPFEIKKYMIDMPREMLFSRINRRVDAMVADGLEEEARRVYPQRALNSLNTVGLKEMFA
ncbi:MAG: tRNA (adenosine(37)-N6)-dimethylallyltransferase MiaA, partial [Bacteroides sp.]|nr:tRNA (adenosine(37)-N6)-dimethylallyltransferase MiaA [Bacteroides sp.]